MVPYNKTTKINYAARCHNKTIVILPIIYIYTSPNKKIHAIKKMLLVIIVVCHHLFLLFDWHNLTVQFTLTSRTNYMH